MTEARARLDLPPQRPAVPDLLAIFEDVREDLDEMRNQIEHLGPLYAAQYVQFIAGKRRPNSPALPAGLSPELAKAIREAVLERATVARMTRSVRAAGASPAGATA